MAQVKDTKISISRADNGTAYIIRYGIHRDVCSNAEKAKERIRTLRKIGYASAAKAIEAKVNF